ncbi:MAG: DNA mismatch repair protein MutS [Oscillospiraceae bacterium]|nr:DNA mismatch repair protein MutS [Oscillospiraceae bacterium]
MIQLAELSPMMRQYMEIKEKNPTALLFFRLGDFYEMFFDDAKTAARELDLTLTGRDCGLDERAPMCGVPFHSYEGYVARLVDKGYKVAICEQLEDPAAAKGIVKRDIVRVITPGTLIESAMLDEAQNNYICSIYVNENSCGICFADISTGEVSATEFSGGIAEKVVDELSRFSPAEILINAAVTEFPVISVFIRNKLSANLELLDEENFSYADARAMMPGQFGGEDVLAERVAATCAVGALLGYLNNTQMVGVERVNRLSYYIGGEYMRLDASTRRNLELLETQRGGDRRGSLIWVLDKTKTAMGRRLLRKWIERPLLSPARIQARLNAVEELFGDGILRGNLSQVLSGIGDIERLMTRIVYGSANGRDLRSLSFTAGLLPDLRSLIEKSSCAELREIYDQIDTLDDVFSLIEAAIAEEPPMTVREGGIIRQGYSEEVDLLREDMDGGDGSIARLESQERGETGIPKLKIGYNRVFGYYIEVTNSYKSQVPDRYIRKQTLSNCERYITPELKEIEGRVLGARDRCVKLEYDLFSDVRTKVAAALDRVQKTADAVAKLDVLRSLAEVSQNNRYVRPQINLQGRIQLADSRHPVVEKLIDMPFVPNNALLDNNDNRVVIITGPNMSGKSTYMRQIALITLMTHMGCFVPAVSADVCVTDGIYTRVGASDDLSSGQSTFMVEMKEVADILHNATQNSLLILDEIGRGTSTFEGMSIARAVLEYVADKRKLGAKAVFATHYHELTDLETSIKCVKNYNITAKRSGGEVIFLRRVVRGGADDSYGIDVAKLAGVPDWVVKRARQVLVETEQMAKGGTLPATRVKGHEPAGDQIGFSLIPAGEQEAVARLKKVDINTISPIVALSMLDELCKIIK